MPTRLDPTYTKKQVDDLVGVITGRKVEDLVLSVVGAGSFDKTAYVTAGYKYVEIIAIAAGGGGAGCPLSAASQNSMAGPGGAGGWAKKVVALSSLGTTEDYSIGAGGTAGGSGAAGGAGGSTTFGTVPIVTATGGAGGTTQASTASVISLAVSGVSGVGTVGDILGAGQPSVPAIGLGAGIGFCPPGASNPYGAGGESGRNGAGSTPTVGFGGGGGGSVNGPSQAARVGVAGRQGGIILRFFG